MPTTSAPVLLTVCQITSGDLKKTWKKYILKIRQKNASVLAVLSRSTHQSSVVDA
jgi:hypothetical protein